MTHRYNVFIREHQLVRLCIEVETQEDVRAAILEVRKPYEQSGTPWSAQAETEIDDAEIFALDEWDPNSGSITQSFEFDSWSVSVDAPID